MFKGNGWGNFSKNGVYTHTHLPPSATPPYNKARENKKRSSLCNKICDVRGIECIVQSFKILDYWILLSKCIGESDSVG